MESSSPKVKKESLAVICSMFEQLGESFRVLVLSMAKSSATRSSIESALGKIHFDSSTVSKTWPRQSIALKGEGPSDGNATLKFEVPKSDLMSILKPDTLTKLVSKMFAACVHGGLLSNPSV